MRSLLVPMTGDRESVTFSTAIPFLHVQQQSGFKACAFLATAVFFNDDDLLNNTERPQMIGKSRTSTGHSLR